MGAGGLKLMIVDDERLMRDGLKLCCDWQEMGIEQIVDASDGKEAFDLARESRPDIVITDIRMPGMDGLTLISQLKPLLPQSVFIIISGYSDFENARKGIELGAFSYILKPIETRLFNKTIQDAVQKIQDSAQEQQNIERLHEHAQQLKEHFVQSLLGGIFEEKSQLAEERLRAQQEEMKVDFRFDSYQVAVFSALKDTDAFACTANGLLLLEEELRAAIPDGQSLFLRQDNAFVLVFGRQRDSAGDLLYDLLEHAMVRLRSCIDYRLVAGVGDEVDGLADICFSYTRAQRIAEAKSFFGIEGIFPGRGEEVAESRILSPMVEKRPLLLAIELSDMEAIRNFVGRFEEQARAYGTEDKQQLFSVIIELMLSAVRMLHDREVSVEQFSHPDIFTVDFLSTFESASQLFRWLERFLETLAQKYKQQESGKEDAIIDQVKAYIARNLHKNLHLSDIAQQFHYNGNYLGRLFRRSVGVKFTDYLQNLRVQSAKEILCETDYSIEEVSRRVGFSDCQYFIRVFKVAVGQTPKRYRASQGQRRAE